MNKQNGYTLIELLIALAIIGILVSIVMGSLPGGANNVNKDPDKYSGQQGSENRVYYE